MKKIILIVGPNGVGKSTTSKLLLKKISKCAYIDSEWCRAINPFPFTVASKETVIHNIFSLFKNYLLCGDIETVIFSYGFHGERKEIFAKVMDMLKLEEISFELFPIILKCSRAENIRRAINDGRDKERIERGLKNTFSFYDKYDYFAIDTTYMMPEEVAEAIMGQLSRQKYEIFIMN